MSLSSEAAKTLAFTYRNITTVRKNVFQLTEIFYFPFITLLSIGFMLKFLSPGDKNTAVVLSGVVALSVLQTCQLDVAYVLLFDMWSKSLKHTMVAPISPRHFLLGSWLVGILRGTVTLLVLTFFINRLFHFNVFQVGAVRMFVFWSGLMVCGLLIGMLTTIALYTFGWRAEIVPWSIVSLMLLFCGIYYPVSVLPLSVQGFSRAIPVTLFLEYYRSAFGAAGDPLAAQKGFALCAVYLFVIYWLMRLAERRAKRRGLFLKMSE